MDPITAFAAAKTAVSGIKAAIKLGKDISSLGSELNKFFENKEVVERAAEKEKNKNRNKSINQTALQNVMNKKALQDAERELRETLMWSGQGDLYRDLVKERARLRKEEREMKERAAFKRQQFIENTVLWTLIAVCVGAFGYGTYAMFSWVSTFNR